MNTNLFVNNRTLKSFAFLLLFSLFSLNSYSQAADNCGTGGAALTVGLSCNYITYNVTSNTKYWLGNTCQAQENPGNPDTIRDDGWAWFTATGASTTIRYNPDSRNIILHLFDGGTAGTPIPCTTNMVELACVNAAGNGGIEEIIYPTTAGRRYYIRIQRYDSNSSFAGEICVFTGAPANDECADAAPITCGDNFASESTNGSDIISSAFTGCVMGDAGVWYNFTGDGQEWTIAATGTGGFDLAMAVIEGNCAGFTAQIACLDDFGADLTETATFNTVIGTSYYVYISDYIDNGVQTGDFSISATCNPPPAAPSNDEPCGADPLVVNGDYLCASVTSGTLSAATDSGLNVSAGSCALVNGSTTNDDVWYSFVATGTAHSVQLLNVSGGTDMSISVFGGYPPPTPGCVVAETDRIICLDDPDPIFEIITGLTIGDTYFVQVYSFWPIATSTTFDICIGSPPPPPANDDPCGSVGLTVNIDLACGVTTAGSVVSALPTFGNVGCVGFSDDDVWFNFQATSTSHVVQLLNIAGSTTDLNHRIFGPFATAGPPNCNVANVGALPIKCSDLNTSVTGGLIIGQFYFVQVWSDPPPGAGAQNTTFDICVGTPPIVANDEACGAIDLTPTINPDFLCGMVTPGTVQWATDSNVTTACGGSSDDDVWYSFVASSVSHSVDLLNIAGSTLDMYIGVYGGFPTPVSPANCASAVVNVNNVVCSDPESTSFPTVIGETYFVQIYTFNGTSNPTTTFDICIGTPPPPPANDDPCGAVSLTVDQFCVAVTGSIASATNSNIDSCVGTPNDDVWYSFVATNALQSVSLLNIFGSDIDLYHAVYGGFNPPNCGAVAVGNNISCNDGNTSNLTGLTIGDTYYIQVFTWDSVNGATTTFDICVTEPCNNLGTINPIPTVCPLIGAATGSNPFTTIPFDGDPVAYLDCNIANVTLEAYTNVNETTSYMVEQIPNTLVGGDYSPTGFSTPQVIPFDDVWADAWTNMPFDFCFYGTTYSQFLVGSNGAITFDQSISAGSSSGWSFNASIPSTAGAITNETIFSVFQDLNPAGSAGIIRSWIVGTTVGCREVHISFVNIPLFSDSTRLFTGKTVLYETTNVIEIYIKDKEIENGNVGPWNGGNAIAGIQGNAAAGEALTPPCRNGLDDNWETFDEAWRFVPTGATVVPDSYTWVDSGGTTLGTNSTLNVTLPDTYTVATQITACGTQVTLIDQIVVTQSSKTWTGAVNTNWFEDGNWLPALIPTAADCVVIPDTSLGSNRYPIADESNMPVPLPPQPGYALNLTVDLGATLEISADTEMVVSDYLDLNGTINVRSTGSLIQINDGAVNVNNNIGSGELNMERTVAGIGSYDYIYWSTPVESFGVGGVSPGSTHIYEWDPNIIANTNGYGDWLPTLEIMQNGKGYIIRNILATAIPLTPVFSGKPNNGIITRAITRGTYNTASPGGDYLTPGGTMATLLDDNWNLVGNPYPSAISASDFITQNATAAGGTPSVITGAVYLWRHLGIPSNAYSNPFYGDFVYNYNPNDYIVHNGTGSTPPGFNGDIAAGQAFFVQMLNSAPRNTSVVRFDNGMRNLTLDNSQFYRTEISDGHRRNEGEKHRIWLDLITSSNTANSILVGYVEGATDGEDNIFDADELSETNSRFYSLINNRPLSIQGKALPFNDTDTVPLGIEISQSGNYSIAINTLDGLFLDTDQAIYLEDTYSGIIHDLRVNPYSFNVEVGIYEDRFVLRYNNESLGIDEFNDFGLEIIAPNNAYIKVTSGYSSISAVTLYDLLGRVLIDKRDINNSEFVMETTSYSDGVYMVKAVLIDGKQKLQKVVIKNMR